MKYTQERRSVDEMFSKIAHLKARGILFAALIISFNGNVVVEKTIIFSNRDQNYVQLNVWTLVQMKKL